jgi:hypothetical protein
MLEEDENEKRLIAKESQALVISLGYHRNADLHGKTHDSCFQRR